MINKFKKQYQIQSKDITQYKKGVYKIHYDSNTKIVNDSKLIIVTSTTPTKSGIGKTTTSIRLNDKLNQMGIETLLCLREPSLGPVFGIKGGAVGFGQSMIEPSNDINLHFSGDFHAITSATNLIASVIDNHIFQGNQLGIKTILFARCLDVNDRSLRNIEIEGNKYKFVITAASEMMAILVLSLNELDLRNRIDNIIIGLDENNKFIRLKELYCTDAILICLKDAIHPNLVFSKRGNPVLVHLGPFANSSLGYNSLIATSLALKMSKLVISEVGFGSDLGFEKYVDLISPIIKRESITILVTSIQGLKETTSSLTLEDGISNLQFHYQNITNSNQLCVICLNIYPNDTLKDINLFMELTKDKLVGISSEKAIHPYQGIESIIAQLSSNSYKIPSSNQPSNSYLENAVQTAKNVYLSKLNIKETKVSQANILPSKVIFAVSPYVYWNQLETKEIDITKLVFWGGANLVSIYTKGIVVLPGINNDARLFKMKYRKYDDFDI
jgi:formate--tetrahydrofolate ligase